VAGRTWWFDVAGSFTSHRGGLLRTEVVWRSLGRAAAVRGIIPPDQPLVLLTTHLPRPGAEGDTALRAAGPAVVHDVVGLLASPDRARLAGYAAGDVAPAPGFWTRADLARAPAPPRS
jgi:hypothetical protein